MSFSNTWKITKRSIKNNKGNILNVSESNQNFKSNQSLIDSFPLNLIFQQEGLVETKVTSAEPLQ